MLFRSATPPLIQLLDVQIEHECHLGNYFYEDDLWGSGLGPFSGVIPVFGYGKGRLTDFTWNNRHPNPPEAGPEVIEFERALDIRNLRVATYGCDAIATTVPCTDIRNRDHDHGRMQDMENARAEEAGSPPREMPPPSCHNAGCDLSRYGIPGLTMTMSAPSLMSRATSLIASLLFLKSI